MFARSLAAVDVSLTCLQRLHVLQLPSLNSTEKPTFNLVFQGKLRKCC